jgi:hypothetical protein
MTTVPTAAKRTVAATGDRLGDELLRVAIEQAGVGSLDGAGGEDAGGEGAEHAADAVDREDVEGVVDARAGSQERAL